jgi:hypothetical protein
MKMLLWVSFGLATLYFFAQPAKAQSNNVKSEIARALSAAPPSLGANAAVDIMDEKGHMKELRRGTNGWTCLISTPEAIAHDPTESHPGCFDKYGLEWIQAYMAGRTPNADHVGYSYMLKGGGAWSNTDPAATKLSRGQKDYIHIPGHIMILNARVANSSGFPSGQPNPNIHAPFVMFGGTQDALLIIPVN